MARAAFETGRAAADPVERLRWLDRAHRLLPADPTLRLALAEACLGRDDARAENLLLSLASRHDAREVWLALAAARRARGDTAGAAKALARTLSRHAMPPALAPFADAVAVAAGAPGWCGLAPDGALLWGPADLAPPKRDSDGCGRLVVTADGYRLLGSPIEAHAFRRVEGFVETAPEGGLFGWAWLPNNPDVDPVLTVRPARGRSLTLSATDAEAASGGGLLARRRGFIVPGERLAGLRGPFRVLGADGRDLLGSPVDPSVRIEAALAAAAPAIPSRRPPAGVDVIIPVHGARAATLACLDSVLAGVARRSRIVVIDDASPDPELARALDRLAARERIVLIRRGSARGFPAAANAGLSAAAAAGRDAVLLNSDTLVASGWLEALRAVAHSAPDIGTVTPLSNRGSILSYPGPEGANPVPDLAGTRRLAALARRANAARVVDIPVGVGFCLYVRHDCLRATGFLRVDLFAQGYGEENDFCLRARQLGWRHVAAPGVFVAHIGGQSFGGAAEALRARNGAVLERRHPGYDALIAAHAVADPLADSRRRIDLLRWRAARPPDPAGAVLIVTHDQGGGVERAIAARIGATGSRALVLRPAHLSDGRIGARVSDVRTAESYPNLVFAVPDEMPALARLLRAERVAHVELHHLLGHAPGILELPRLLGVPYEVHVHDYAWLCPRVALLGVAGRYCGEPDVAGCGACVAAAGNLLEEDIGPAALRARSAGVLAGARRVVVPSADPALRLARYFPGVIPDVVAHEDDSGLADSPPPLRDPGICRIVVIGAVGVAKGYDVLLACARDAAARTLPLGFVVVGHTIDDAPLLATGRAFVTGPYAPDEAVALIRAQKAAIAFIPSVVPETWCFTLTEAWRAGLRAVAFDLGAQAERVRATGRGSLLRLGESAARINDALLAACGVSRHEGRIVRKREQVPDARHCQGPRPPVRCPARRARPRAGPRDGTPGLRPPDDA